MTDAAQIARDAIRLGDELLRYARYRVCELFEETELSTLRRSYVENRIIVEFQADHGWHPDLDLPMPPSKTITYGQNRLHLARKSLVEAGILEPTNPKSDRQYVLAIKDSVAFDDLIQEGALAWSRRSSIANAPDTVYVIVDTRHPDICKVGTSHGGCSDRLAEANRWTAQSCDVRLTKYCDRGKGFNFEARIHNALESRNGEPQGEWFNCSGDDAARVIEELARALNIG